MKFNDINLVGVFKLKGETGDDGQIIKYINGEPVWGQSIPPIPPIIRGLGNNFIIVESVHGDPFKSGDNLVEGYNKAVELATSIGATIDNRITILVMPGTYDLSNSILTISTSFIDVIGFSSNPYSTIFQSTPFEYPLEYDNVDSKLENIFLKSGFGLSLKILSDSFLRWKNVVMEGPGFGDGFSYFAVDNLRGEFEDITLKPSTSFAVVTNSIDAIFKNIYFEGNSSSAFYSTTDGMIQGTFSNITFEYFQGNVFHHNNQNSDQEMILNIDNFKILGGFGNLLFSGGTMSCNLNNVYLNLVDGPPDFLFFSGKTLQGNLKNIKINFAGSGGIFIGIDRLSANIDDLDIVMISSAIDIFNSSRFITSTFSDIKIQGVDEFTQLTSMFRIQTSDGEINSTIDNLKVNNLTLSNAFTLTSGTFSGSYRNIEIEKGLQSFFFGTSRTNIKGLYENFYVNSLSNRAFVGGGALGGYVEAEFNNINFKNVGIDCDILKISNPSVINSRINGLSIENSSGSTPRNIINFTEIYGSYRDINIRRSQTLLTAATISCEVDGVYLGPIISECFYGSNFLSGTFSNIETLSNQNLMFNSDGPININVENLYLREVGANFMVSTNNTLNSKMKNVWVDVLFGNSIDTTNFDINVELENCFFKSGKSNSIFSSGNGDIYATFSNVEIGIDFADVFLNNNNYLTFKDVYIRTVQSPTFPRKGFAIGKFDNLQSFNRTQTFVGVFQNSLIVDPLINTTQSSITITSSTILENSDFYVSRKDTLGSAQIDYSVRNSIVGTISNAHVLNCGMISPLAGSRYSDGSEFTFGVTALDPSFNVFGIPQPRQLD